MTFPVYFVDVRGIVFIAENKYFGGKFEQKSGSGFIGRAVPAIGNDAQTFESRTARKRRFGKFNVATQRSIDPDSFSNPASGRANRFNFPAENEPFNLRFDVVVELEAIGTKKFYPVVVIRIV